MSDKSFKSKLKSLYPDITCSGRNALMFVSLINESVDDKAEMIRNLYFRDHAPVRVTNPGNYIKGGHYDLEDELIAISEGYDNYIKNMGEEAEHNMYRHIVALEILTNMLSLPDPYARMLYLHFYKGYRISQIADMFFTSKTTCYRNIQKGIDLLYKRMSIEQE